MQSARARDGVLQLALSMQPGHNCLLRRSGRTASLDQHNEPGKESSKMTVHQFITNSLFATIGLLYVSLLPCMACGHIYSLGIVGFEPAIFFFKSHKEPSKKITRQSVVKRNCTYRGQFGKYTSQAFLKSKISYLCCYSFHRS